jgi:hypothetical protein
MLEALVAGLGVLQFDISPPFSWCNMLVFWICKPEDQVLEQIQYFPE